MLCAIFGECTFILSHYLRSVSTIAAFYVGGYLAALGAYSSTLDYSLAHSASGEGPSVSSARVAISVVRSSSKSASSGGSGSSPNSTLYHLWWEARARTLAASSDAERCLKERTCLRSSS